MRSCQFNPMTSLYPASKHVLHISHTGNTNLVFGLHELCAAYSMRFLFLPLQSVLVPQSIKTLSAIDFNAARTYYVDLPSPVY